MKSKLTIEEALMTVLDQVDYVRGNCAPTEMVAAVLPKEIILLAHEALEEERSRRDKVNGIIYYTGK